MITLTAETLMMAGGLVAFLVTILLVRRRELREKYAVLWVLFSTVVMIVGFAPNALKTLAEATNLSYATAVLFPTLVTLYFFAFWVTISMSRTYRRNIRLVQEMGLLENRIRELEERLGTERDGRTK